MAAIKDEKEDNKTGKMLALFDIMIHGHPLTKEQIATRFDVNARTANRYLAAIRQYLEEAEKEDGPRRELRYSREDRTYRIAEVENRFISKSELFAICKILLGGRTYSRKDLESLMNRLPYAKRLPKERSNAEPVSKSPDRRGKAQMKAPFRQKGNIFIRSGRRCQNSTGRQDNIRPSFLLQGRPPFGGKISKTEQIGKIKTLQPRLAP